MNDPDKEYVSKFYLGPERTSYMTDGDLKDEKEKLGKMITMIDNALAKREAAPKNAILQIVTNKVEKIEGLKKKLEVTSDSQEAFFMDAPPTQQQQQQQQQLQASSSSSSSLFTQVTLSPSAAPRSERYSPAGMATTATEAYAVRVVLVEEKEK
jgi:hypothetical protein